MSTRRIANVPRGCARHLCVAPLMVILASCASEPTPAPEYPKAEPAPPSAPAAVAQSSAPKAAPSAPTLCEVGNTEQEVADEVLARSGRGLLWLVVPSDENGDRKAVVKRGAAEVLSARALAECLLRSHGPGFDETQAQGLIGLERWLDQHVGPEHAPTLLAAGAAYSASLLVSKSWIDAAFDVPIARTFLERATKFAPQLADGLGPLMLGAYECYVPKPIGGQPDAGKQRLEQAASHPGRLQLAMKIVEAELCAFALQDHALFDRLLAEVEAAQGSLSPFDWLAKQRVRTLRVEAEQMFPDDY